MLVQSLVATIEAAAADEGRKNLTGNLRDPSRFLTVDALTKLNAAHDGVFAFLAFAPGLDPAVSDYVLSGALTVDTGRHVLALFTLADVAGPAKSLSRRDLGDWVQIGEPHPSARIAAALMPREKPPRLPGLVVVPRLLDVAEPVYVELHDAADPRAVRERCQVAFQLAQACYVGSRGEGAGAFAECYAVALKKRGVPYVRGGPTSIREWLLDAFRIVREHAGDIVSAIRSLKGAA